MRYWGVSLFHEGTGGQAGTVFYAAGAWYVAPALSGRRLRSCAIAAGMAVSLAVSACGGGTRQDAQERHANYAVQVPSATFPADQNLAQPSQMLITVRNAGAKTIPDVAVTITDARYGTTAQAFAERISAANAGPSQPILADASRPVWVVDRGPGVYFCPAGCLAAGGGGAGGQTAYSNTWALGALAPGRSATFRWSVTAVKPGVHVVRYRVAAGLNGNAVAELSGGGPPVGTFSVTIHSAPQQSYVNNAGQVVVTP
jgi:hypothetical protein